MVDCDCNKSISLNSLIDIENRVVLPILCPNTFAHPNILDGPDTALSMDWSVPLEARHQFSALSLASVSERGCSRLESTLHDATSNVYGQIHVSASQEQ